jgi:hypothetical protein
MLCGIPFLNLRKRRRLAQQHRYLGTVQEVAKHFRAFADTNHYQKVFMRASVKRLQTADLKHHLRGDRVFPLVQLLWLGESACLPF